MKGAHWFWGIISVVFHAQEQMPMSAHDASAAVLRLSQCLNLGAVTLEPVRPHRTVCTLFRWIAAPMAFGEAVATASSNPESGDARYPDRDEPSKLSHGCICHQ